MHFLTRRNNFYIVLGSPNYQNFDAYTAYANSSAFTIIEGPPDLGPTEPTIIVPVTLNSSVAWSVPEYIGPSTLMPTVSATNSTGLSIFPTQSNTMGPKGRGISGSSVAIGIGIMIGFILVVVAAGWFIWRTRNMWRKDKRGEQIASSVPAQEQTADLNQKDISNSTT